MIIQKLKESDLFMLRNYIAENYGSYIFDYGWVAGGCVQNYFFHKTISINTDVDVFTPDFDTFMRLKHDFQFNYDIIVETENVIKFENRYSKRKLDLVKLYFNSPTETIQNFDFTVCCAAVDENYFYCNDNYMLDLASKHLRINSLPYPVSTLKRLVKYIKKGYTPCIGTMLELGRAIVNLSEEEFNKQQIFYYD